MPTLTETRIRAGKPAEKPYKVFDERGLFMLVTPSGGRLWRLRYRHGGVEKLLAIGAYPDVSLKRARENRDDARKLVADGIDPSAKGRADKEQQVNTFEAVAREWLALQEKSLDESTLTRERSRFRTSYFLTSVIDRSNSYLFPSLRTPTRPISDNTLNAALRRLGYSGEEMTGHGFRSMASTCLNELGWHPDLIELQLAHAERNRCAQRTTVLSG